MGVDGLNAAGLGRPDAEQLLSITKDSALASNAESDFRDALSEAASASDPEKIQKAAKDFESLMISQILKAVHESSDGGWLGSDDDQAGSMAVELAEESFAQAMAAGGGFGISQLVQKGLSNEAKIANSGQSQLQPAPSAYKALIPEAQSSQP